MDNLKYIHLLYVPTMACNMECKYCYLEDNTNDLDKSIKPIDTLKYAIEKFLKGKFYIVPGLKIKLAKIGCKIAPTNIVAKISYNMQKRKKGTGPF